MSTKYSKLTDEESYKLDLFLLKRFINLFINFINDNDKKYNQILLLFFLLFICFLEQFIVYQVGIITADFYRILSDKDLPQFTNHCLYSLMLIAIISGIKAAKSYVSSVLYIYWRQIFTKKLHKLYFYSNFYYQINVMNEENKIENPDQRITQDIEKFCSDLSCILPDLLIAPFTILYYSLKSYRTVGKTLRCSRIKILIINNHFLGYFGPLGCFIFFLISSSVNSLLMSPIVKFVYAQEKAEVKI